MAPNTENRMASASAAASAAAVGVGNVKPGATYSLKDIAEHNTAESCWIAIHDKVYDVTSFVDKHPGHDFLYLGAGKDASNMYDSLHPNYVDEKYLPLYYIGDVEFGPDEEKLSISKKTEFYPVLKSRVERHLKENHLNAKGSPAMVAKSCLILSAVVLFYLGAMYIVDSLLTAVVLGVFLGLAWGNVGTNVMHDGNHGSYSSNGVISRAVGLTCDFVMGASSYVWLYQHVVGHHVHTNIIGLDPDIRTSDPDLRRLYPEQKWYPRYLLQHIYAGLLYGLLTFKWFVQDYTDLSAGRVYINKMQHFDSKEWLIFYGGKIFFIAYAMVAPLLLGTPPLRVLLVLVAAGVAEGYWLAFFFQVNHVTDRAVFVPKSEMHEWDWAELQVVGTTNFSSGSQFWNSVSGGLSHQCEHHLFPGVCHMHYPAISHIMQATCEEFNVEYRTYPSFPSAVMGHINYLWKMGQEPATKED